MIFMGFSMCSENVYAQIDYRFIQFQQNPLPVNPAYSGIEDFVDLKLGYRVQWAGFENSPTNLYFSGNMAFRISPSNDYKHKGIRLFEPNAFNELENDNEFGYRKGKRHGIGFYILQNSDAAFTNFAGYVTYAYHLRITNQLIWSVGAAVGYENNKFDPSGISVLNPTNDATYLAYLNGANRKSQININVGTIIYHRQFFLGYSATNAASFNITGNNDFYNNQVENLTHVAHFGFRYKWKYGVWVTPSLLIIKNKETPIEAVGSLRIRYQDVAWAGIHYSYLGAVGLSAGTYLSKNIAFNYAYEFPATQLHRVTSGSHEVVLAFKLNNRNYSRAYLW